MVDRMVSVQQYENTYIDVVRVCCVPDMVLSFIPDMVLSFIKGEIIKPKIEVRVIQIKTTEDFTGTSLNLSMPL